MKYFHATKIIRNLINFPYNNIEHTLYNNQYNQYNKAALNLPAQTGISAFQKSFSAIRKQGPPLKENDSYFTIGFSNQVVQVNSLDNFGTTEDIFDELSKTGPIHTIYARPNFEWWVRFFYDCSTEKILDSNNIGYPRLTHRCGTLQFAKLHEELAMHIRLQEINVLDQIVDECDSDDSEADWVNFESDTESITPTELSLPSSYKDPYAWDEKSSCLELELPESVKEEDGSDMDIDELPEDAGTEVPVKIEGEPIAKRIKCET